MVGLLKVRSENFQFSAQLISRYDPEQMNKYEKLTRRKV